MELVLKGRRAFRPYRLRTQRYAVPVAHRRCGKTVACVQGLIDRSTTLPCQLAATPTIGEIAQSDIGRHGVSFLFGALNRRLQTFLPRSTPRTEILIPIPIPPPENAGERTSPEGGAGHSIKSARVRTGSTGRRLPLLERERIKRQTIANRRLQHQLLAAQSQSR
jgi:hypothetical protein